MPQPSEAESQQPPRAPRWINIVSLLVLAAAFAPLVWNAFYARPQVDDFWYGARVINHGLLEAQRQWFMEWSGRYTGSFIMSVLMTLPGITVIYPVIPIVTLLLVPPSLWFLARRVLTGVLAQYRAPAVAMLSIGTVYPMIRIGESIYWASGAVIYTWAACVLFVTAGLLLAPRGGGREAAMVGLLCALACGLNEIAAALLVGYSIVGCTHFMAGKRSPPINLLVALVSSLVFGVVSLVAPGNGVRYEWQLEVTTVTSFSDVANAVLVFTLREIYTCISSATFVACGLLVAALVLRYGHLADHARWQPRRLLLCVPIVLAAVLCAHIPAAIASASQPVWRAVDFVNSMFLVTWLLGLGATLLHVHPWLTKKVPPLVVRFVVPAAGVLFLAGLIPAIGIRSVINDLGTGTSQAYSRQIDARFELAKDRAARGIQDVPVPSLDPAPGTLMYLDVDPNPEEIISRNCGIFLGVRSVYLTHGESRMADGNEHYRYR